MARTRIALAGLLLAALSGCTHNGTQVRQKEAVITTLDPTADLLLNDIFLAQEIVQHKPGKPLPDEPITYEFGTNARHKAYHFANLRAFRLDIKRRMDSLRLAGYPMSYDTVVTGQGPVGKMHLRY